MIVRWTQALRGDKSSFGPIIMTSQPKVIIFTGSFGDHYTFGYSHIPTPTGIGNGSS
jgi:hypothetical protein